MNLLTIIIIIIIAVILTNLLRQFLLNKLSKQLYQAAYVKKDKELFNILIESPQTKMVMSDTSRNIMALNFYLSIDDENNVISTAKKLINRKLNIKEAQTVYPSTIGYLCEKENVEALVFLENMKKEYGNTSDINMILMIYDCELTYDIYIRKDTSRIKDIEEVLKTDLDADSKAVYQYRLAKLYYYDNNKDKAKSILLEAKSNTSDQNAKKKIEKILNGKWGIL